MRHSPEERTERVASLLPKNLSDIEKRREAEELNALARILIDMCDSAHTHISTQEPEHNDAEKGIS